MLLGTGFFCEPFVWQKKANDATPDMEFNGVLSSNIIAGSCGPLILLRHKAFGCVIRVTVIQEENNHTDTEITLLTCLSLIVIVNLVAVSSMYSNLDNKTDHRLFDQIPCDGTTK